MPILIKFGTNYPWVKGIIFFSNQRPGLFTWEIILKKSELG
jgi:hypothetical protein